MPLILAAESIASAFLLYWRVLWLPLYHDDIVANLSVANTTLGSLLTTAGDTAYYRPLGRGIWKLYQLAVGEYWLPVVLHGHHLALFILSAWLVGMLARRLIPDRPLLWIVAVAMFTAFPFSYQSVPWASAGVHIQIMAGTLAGIYFIDQWWDSQNMMQLVAGNICLALGIFSHESGVIVWLLVAVWFIFGRRLSVQSMFRENKKKITLAIVPAMLLCSAYLAIWAILPKVRGQESTLNFPNFSWNALYFLQGLTYPIAQSGGALVRAGLDPVVAASLVNALGCGLLFLLLRQAKAGHAWLGIAWFGLSLLPATLFLTSAYIVDSPRLLTIASPGVVWAWVAGLDSLTQEGKAHRSKLQGLLAVFLILSGAWFVATRMALHDLIGPIYHEMLDTVHADGKTAFVINMPAWVAPAESVYALGNEGVGYLAGYYPFRDFVWSNTGYHVDYFNYARTEVWPLLSRDIVAGIAAENLPVSPERHLEIMRTSPLVMRVKAVNNRWVMESGQPVPESALSGAAVFANAFRLLPEAAVDPARNLVKLTLDWEVPESENVSVFVHLLCGEEMIGQADGAPLGGLYPFDQWLPGTRWQETRLIGLPDGTADDCLKMRVGLYDPESGQRVRLAGSTDEFILIDVR